MDVLNNFLCSCITTNDENFKNFKNAVDSSILDYKCFKFKIDAIGNVPCIFLRKGSINKNVSRNIYF